ncbi:hypothetical protein [Pedobacter suwonensis]|uniref:hypothetical protein n=1 Tax=Pedobacter suwonensis TaxID=332999 RepID=UPI0025DDDDEA|nr:hypothetical protein [uncultured Pedobacter sp.]
MFEDYKKAILDFYRIKKENHRLSLNLEAPRRDRLRAECAKVFLRKNSKVDRDFIRSVFDPTNEYEDQMRSIERFDLDRFRALVSFLTIEGRDIRDDRLVKLLAWLIDFPPYNEWRELSEEELKFIFEEAAKKPEDEEIAEPIISKPTSDIKVSDNVSTTQPPQIVIVGEPTGGSNGEDVIRTEQPKGPKFVPRFYPRYITISCIVLLFIGTTSFAVWERRTKIRMPEPEEKFMYWDEDHYEPVKGGKQNAGAPIIPLNENTLRQQQKITLPDTLTSYSIGKVWYKGHGKDHEFFTASGPYPQDLQRVLKPLTNTILTKYTSNYRYILTRLVWFICAAFFISLCGYGASKLEKEVKPAVKEPDTEEEETTALLGNELQATGA